MIQDTKIDDTHTKIVLMRERKRKQKKIKIVFSCICGTNFLNSKLIKVYTNKVLKIWKMQPNLRYTKQDLD